VGFAMSTDDGWNIDLFDIGVVDCCKFTFIPCVPWAQLHTRKSMIGDNTEVPTMKDKIWSGFMIGVCCSLPWFLTCQFSSLRRQIRDEYGIVNENTCCNPSWTLDNCFVDGYYGCCCYPCALHQEWEHVKNGKGFDGEHYVPVVFQLNKPAHENGHDNSAVKLGAANDV